MKIFGVGRNFGKHALELGNKIPSEPVIFLMPDTAILKSNAPFYFPEFTNQIDYEIELVVKIDREGKNIATKFAHKYYNEIGIGIDFTARDVQKNLVSSGLPWSIAKGFNGSLPVSEFLPKSELDLNDATLKLDINKEQRQFGNINDMIFSIDDVISYLSKFFTLKKGDLIYMGTPSGVGPIAVGDVLEGYLNDIKLLDFEIK